MGYNYFIFPGEILKEYMEEREISQKLLAEKTESSERHISRVVNGKARISEEFALKLEKVFSDVKAEFWLNLEMSFQLHILRNKNDNSIDYKKIVEDYKLNSVFKGKSYTAEESVEELLRISGVPNYAALETLIYNSPNYQFLEDGGEEKTIFLWLKLCERQLNIQNDLENFNEFDLKDFRKGYSIIKKLLNTQNYVFAFSNIRKILNKFGIALVIEDAIPTSKIRGATTNLRGIPVIYLSKRYKRIDSLYFSLLHEIYHILNEDYKKEHPEISYEIDDREKITNELTRNFFIEKSQYEIFVMENNFTIENILIFANQNGIVVDILLGFLQRDGLIDYSNYNHLRTYITEGVDF